ncbi:MAG TPA: RagB/SusD family nutrient uptake outer membrane protein [Chitinophagaceae bacterium]|jgi:hypothetical protein|nr:RagB/SusD family nutrient uptake outer membrane protein [Chitinophagaceae bacterium]
MKRFKYYFFFLTTLGLGACTKLDERFRSEIENASSGNITPEQLLRTAYNAMNGPYQDQSRVWAAQQHTTDETIGPTRGPDWDDNGVWRVLHAHNWNADHGFLRDTYRELLQIQFAASNVLQFNPSAQQAAEARFIRAFSMFTVLDGWNQVPYRENLNDYKVLPVTLKGTEALDFIMAELNAIIATLPEGPVYIANKDAARTLLMKCYLNRAVYANRQQPDFAGAGADMQQVITLADQIIGSNKYSLEDNFFDNFAPTNSTISQELIWGLENTPGVRGGNVRFHAHAQLHYNQNPSGWNGFATLSDLYDKFEATDKRRTAEYPGVTNVSGLRVGLLLGQQFDKDGNPLKDRKGNNLAFTREVRLVENGNNLEVTGIRVVKYPPDYQNPDQWNNEFVIFRYADVLLMKAEALLRTNKAPEALVIVNALRAKRGATPLLAVTLDNLLDERARELYWEGWRRNDLIRFGKFLQAWQEKPASDPKYLLFAIPNEQLAVNPNLEQNPGY